ncbi:hypothetical protein M1432_01180 [Patescibacteria group bacterium]|nr:hypothetical protein [Patescibacteria group bacterium]
MVHFILQTVIFLALGAMVYLLAAALPRVGESEENGPGETSRFMAYIERADEVFQGFWEKSLRRVRVWLLRLDNLITKRLGRFRKEIPKEGKLPLMENEETVDKEENSH